MQQPRWRKPRIIRTRINPSGLKQLREAFFALPEEQRDALHLVAIEGLFYQEAANALSIPVGTLMSRISRARQRLREFEESGASRWMPIT